MLASTDTRITLSVTGPVAAVLRIAADLDALDISARPADLDELFLSYYRTDPDGWINANLYANFVPLIVLLLSIGYGASAIAGQDEDATLSLIATLPISRRQIAIQKFVAMSLQAIQVAAVTALGVVAGRGFGLPIPPVGVLGVTVGVVLLGIDFGAIALLTGRRAIAPGAKPRYSPRLRRRPYIRAWWPSTGSTCTDRAEFGTETYLHPDGYWHTGKSRLANSERAILVIDPSQQRRHRPPQGPQWRDPLSRAHPPRHLGARAPTRRRC